MEFPKYLIRYEEYKKKENSEEGEKIAKQLDAVIGEILLEDGFKYTFPHSFFKAIGFELAKRGYPITKENVLQVLKELLSPFNLDIEEAIRVLEEEGFLKK